MVSASCLAWRLPVRAKASMGIVGGIVGLVAGIGLVAVIVNRIRADLGLVATGFSFLAAVVVYGLVWVALSMMLPRATNDLGAVLPGGVLVGLTIAGMQAVSQLCLPNRLGQASELYGAIGVTIVALGWFFILGRAMVLSMVSTPSSTSASAPSRGPSSRSRCCAFCPASQCGSAASSTSTPMGDARRLPQNEQDPVAHRIAFGFHATSHSSPSPCSPSARTHPAYRADDPRIEQKSELSACPVKNSARVAFGPRRCHRGRRTRTRVLSRRNGRHGSIWLLPGWGRCVDTESGRASADAS